MVTRNMHLVIIQKCINVTSATVCKVSPTKVDELLLFLQSEGRLRAVVWALQRDLARKEAAIQEHCAEEARKQQAASRRLRCVLCDSDRVADFKSPVQGNCCMQLDVRD